jgi:hypothetical protein
MLRQWPWGDLSAQLLSAAMPAMAARHIGLIPGLVDEDEAGGIDAALVRFHQRLALERDCGDGRRQGEYDVEIRDRQQVCGPRFSPLARRAGLSTSGNAGCGKLMMSSPLVVLLGTLVMGCSGRDWHVLVDWKRFQRLSLLIASPQPARSYATPDDGAG